MNDTTEHVRLRFRRFAEDECKGYSARYFRLSHAVAQDDYLPKFISLMPDQQPNLFFASVQYLTGPKEMPMSRSELSRFVREHEIEVAQLMMSRRTQTNEVGRCAVLLPAMPAGPLALVEVGASAGLCLLLDKYRYDYESLQIGDSESPVRLRCRLRGSLLPRITVPQIVWRCGLDTAPVDLDDPSAVRWLLACVWPDHPARRERLAAAIEVGRQQSLSVRHGDLVDDLPNVLEEAPTDATLVVFHSAVFPYVVPERRQAFARIITEFSRHRDIVWISNEGSRGSPHISSLAPPPGPLQFLLGRSNAHDGFQNANILGFAHPHGADLEWLADSDGTM